MKTILLSTALMISGVAYAQADPRDAGQPIGSGATLTPGTTMGERDTHGANMPAAPTASTTTTTDSMGTSGSGSTMTTQDSTTTTGTMSTDTTGSGTVAVVQQGGNMAPAPEPRADYPRCSRTVTDNCVQDESRASDRRGGPPARRRR